MENEVIIKVENLVARYGDETIIDGVSFNVHKGEIFVILGGSGCGKSTLLRHMIGLDSPFSGRIIIDGIDITQDDDTLFFKVLKNIGVLFQSSALLGSMTIAENIGLSIKEHSNLPKNVIEKIVNMKLKLVGLQGYGNYLPSEISGGMKKRAGLARALALNPKILFLDEPSAGLDPVISAEIDELIMNINKTTGATVVIVTHELESIFTIAQTIIMLEKQSKGIIAKGDPEFLKKNSTIPYVRRFFNRKTCNLSISWGKMIFK